MADLIKLCPHFHIQQNHIPRALAAKMVAKFDSIVETALIRFRHLDLPKGGWAGQKLQS